MSEALANAYGGIAVRPMSTPKRPKNLAMSPAGPRANVEIASFIFPDMRALCSIGINLYADLSYAEIKISGYEIYMVEQWVAERNLSSIITSYTGNSQDVVNAVQVILPKDPKLWPGQFKQYHEQLMSFSQPVLIADGYLFLTNLSTLPSSLNIYHIESGDLRSVWKDFKINFDLKNLRCTGRSGALLSEPSNAALEKFSQIYRVPMNTGNDYSNGNINSSEGPNDTNTNINTSANTVGGSPKGISSFDAVGSNALTNNNNNNNNTNINTNTNDPSLPSKRSQYPSSTSNKSQNYNTKDRLKVIGMIELVQTSLFYFNIYNNRRDGLLCNLTKRAVDRWWDEYGRLYLGIDKPKNESSIGPTTVASLLSLVLSCYFKLILEDCVSARDPFDTDEFFAGISNFQRKYGLARDTRVYLDHLTLEKLFKVASKPTNEVSKFRKLLKCRMQDIKGRNNPIHLAKHILTTDLDTLVGYFHDGGSFGLIWGCKARYKRITGVSGYEEKQQDFRSFNFSRGNPRNCLLQQEERMRLIAESASMTAQDSSAGNVCRGAAFVRDDYFGPGVSSTANSVDTSRYGNDNMGSTGGYSLTVEYGENGSRLFGSDESISSMVCNYDRAAFLDNADINKRYFREFYRRNSFPCINDGTKVDLSEDLEDEVDYETTLYRCNSQSQVSNALERWELPFDPSVVKIARDLRRIEVAADIEKRIQEMRESKLTTGEAFLDRQRAREDFAKITQQLLVDHDKYAEDSEEFREDTNVLENKQELLLTEMKEINSLTSKLKYDVKILDMRMRDVEESVKQFDAKLKNIDRAVIVQDSDILHALNSVTNKIEFDERIRNLVKLEDTYYKGICLKILDTGFFKDLKSDIRRWFDYLFYGLSKRTATYSSVQPKDTPSEFSI